MENNEIVKSKAGERDPDPEMKLFGEWANIPYKKVEKLANLALPEKWYYGSKEPTWNNKFPILTNYLNYTFKRLCSEEKIIIKEYDGYEYAAFNTGLVDRKYQYIYALFAPDTRYKVTYWYLVDFVIAGEDIGKTLTKYFNPLPPKANYFENKIEYMFYDTSTGDLYCDYQHILIENISRLPIDFLKDNCPKDILSCDGMDIDTACGLPYEKYKERESYFKALGEKIAKDSRILNHLKDCFDAAVNLALKRVEWNYKTAIPMYYPEKTSCCLLLPLALVDINTPDLALVVDRQPSGNYQGQTILPLNLAYSNSRLITRPDSDWLATTLIAEDGKADDALDSTSDVAPDDIEDDED